jgi:hypothetical protein
MSRSSLSQFPSRPRAAAEHFPHAGAASLRVKNDLQADIVSEFRRKPDFTRSVAAF